MERQEKCLKNRWIGGIREENFFLTFLPSLGEISLNSPITGHFGRTAEPTSVNNVFLKFRLIASSVEY